MRDGWLYTGDLARMDEDGYFYIVERKKDLIIAGGYKIYPREVEEVLYQHPGVQEAVAFGVPDAYRGETVKVVIVPQDGAALTAAEIEDHCRRLLAVYKVPKIIEFRSELPKSRWARSCGGCSRRPGPAPASVPLIFPYDSATRAPLPLAEIPPPPGGSPETGRGYGPGGVHRHYSHHSLPYGRRVLTLAALLRVSPVTAFLGIQIVQSPDYSGHLPGRLQGGAIPALSRQAPGVSGDLQF